MIELKTRGFMEFKKIIGKKPVCDGATCYRKQADYAVNVDNTDFNFCLDCMVIECQDIISYWKMKQEQFKNAKSDNPPPGGEKETK